jgi:hypothetical protein
MELETKPQNPEAFPVLDPNGSFWNPGMSLRDYFANSAMQSVMIGEDYKTVQTPDQVAQWSYSIADAMLKERLR